MSGHEGGRAQAHANDARRIGAHAMDLGPPGKQTLAEIEQACAAHRGPHAAGAAPVQRAADPAAAPAETPRPVNTAAWMAAMTRPDHHEALVQRKPATAEPGPLPSDGGGKALPEDVRGKMEGALGADFSAVRIHEGPRSAALTARAYTQGTDIHFAPGEYQPHSRGGQELLGHELAHVVQQRQGRVSATTQAKGVAVNDDAGLEREADEMGARAARGETAHGATAGATASAAPPRVGRDPGAMSSASAPVQMMKFKDLRDQEYDPELYPASNLQQLLDEWRRVDLRGRSVEETQMVRNRISQLETFIAHQNHTTGGRPSKAHLGVNFESKHVIHGNQLDNTTVKQSVDKSIAWDRTLNSVLHLSYVELSNLQQAAMTALSQQRYPEDRMVTFQMRFGVVTQYKEAGSISGVIGDFNIFSSCNVTLGVTLDSRTWEAKIMHMERQVEWPPIASYQYTGSSVVKLWGQGRASFTVA